MGQHDAQATAMREAALMLHGDAVEFSKGLTPNNVVAGTITLLGAAMARALVQAGGASQPAVHALLFTAVEVIDKLATTYLEEKA
jgi:hypothetical protein